MAQCTSVTAKTRTDEWLCCIKPAQSLINSVTRWQ